MVIVALAMVKSLSLYSMGLLFTSSLFLGITTIICCHYRHILTLLCTTSPISTPTLLPLLAIAATCDSGLGTRPALSLSPNLRIPDPNESSLYLSLPLPLPLGSACLPACTSAYKSYYHARPRLQSSPCVSNVKQPPFRTPAVSCRLLPSQDGEPMISYGASLFLSCHTKVHYCLVLTAQPLPLFQMVDSILPDPCTCSHRESQQEWEVCGDVTCGANITAGT